MERNTHFNNFYTEKSLTLIKSFFDCDSPSEETVYFFNTLHNFQTKKLFTKSWRVKVTDIGKMWGIFNFNNDYAFEEQTLQINSFERIKNKTYKKALQLINYLHEATHEKQRDYYIYNNEKNIKENSQYYKVLNLEVFCYEEAKQHPNYEQLLIEIDAIHNSIVKYKYLLENNCMQKSSETLSVLLYACVRYIASINGAKHHTYYPKKFVLDCKNLINYYKKFYSNLNINGKTFNEIIDYSDLYNIKKEELKNIEFNAIETEINNKTAEVFALLQETFNEILNFYKPSEIATKYFEEKNTSWKKILKNNNIVNLSAIICCDLHANFEHKIPSFIDFLTKPEEHCF